MNQNQDLWYHSIPARDMAVSDAVRKRQGDSSGIIRVVIQYYHKYRRIHATGCNKRGQNRVDSILS
jgi:hypothetical protein